MTPTIFDVFATTIGVKDGDKFEELVTLNLGDGVMLHLNREDSDTVIAFCNAIPDEPLIERIR